MDKIVISAKHVTINVRQPISGKPIQMLGTLEEFSRSADTKDWQRFEKYHDGSTIVDHKTGLMWPVEESPKRMNFADAEAYAASLELGTFNDWRLPIVEELESIRDLTRHEPCLDTDFFQSNSSWVWSRTPCAWSSDRAWVVLFSNGHVNNDSRNSTAFVRPVRAVSAGQ